MQSYATVGIDHFIRTFQLSDGSLVNCYIYDTCGQERYNSLNESYYKRANAILLVYSIANIKSFEKVKKYYVPKIAECCQENIPILLLGNKSDLEDKRQVSMVDGANLALQEKYEFLESSCLLNTNVSGAFETLVETWNFQNNEVEKKNLNEPKSSKNVIAKNWTEIDFEIIMDDFKLDDFSHNDAKNSFDDNVVKKSYTLNDSNKNKTRFVLNIEKARNKKKKKCC